MAYYIDKAKFVSEVLTNSEQQLKFRGMTGNEAYFEVLRLVNDMPAADAAPVRHGRWVRDDKYEDWAERYVCSECRRNALTDGDYRHKLSVYCPNCGARMDGGADNGE